MMINIIITVIELFYYFHKDGFKTLFKSKYRVKLSLERKKEKKHCIKTKSGLKTISVIYLLIQ